MKYLFALTLFFSPAVFLGASPGRVGLLTSSTVSQVHMLRDTLSVKPIAIPAVVHLSMPLPGLAAAALSRKLSFKEKLVIKILKHKVLKFGRGDPIDPRKAKLGKWSLYLGVAAFALAIVPIAQILSIPLAIAAVITGIISLQGNSNTYGIIGIGLGAGFILLTALLILVIIALLV
ncbi:MAG: hypothetical protein ABI151_13055 [Chitinophagaceae bacterium]